MNNLIEYLFIFAFCATAGWVLEVVYRSLVGKHFVNPGFLSGCCLPIYGIGGLTLYILCIPLYTIESLFLRFILVFLVGSLVMTVIELIGGLILLKFYNIRLWDYSDLKCNYKGLICLRFSIYWGICCIIFYLALYPFLQNIATNVTDITWVFIIGFYYGAFAIDLAESLNLAAKLKEHSAMIKSTINVEKIKLAALEAANKYKKKRLGAVFPHGSVKDYLLELKQINREKREQLLKKINKN